MVSFRHSIGVDPLWKEGWFNAGHGWDDGCRAEDSHAFLRLSDGSRIHNVPGILISS